MLPTTGSAANCNFTTNTVIDCDASGVVMENFNFSGKKIKNVDFSHAELLGAIFNKSDLSNVNFNDANLYGAFFVEARISNVNFTNADLSRADFTGVKCISCSFDGANQVGVFFGEMGKAAPKIDVEKSNREYEQRQTRIKKDLDAKAISSIPSQAVEFNNANVCNSREDLLTWLSLNGSSDPWGKLRLELLVCGKRSERVSTEGKAVTIYDSSWGQVVKITDGTNTVYAKKAEISILAELPRSINKPSTGNQSSLGGAACHNISDISLKNYCITGDCNTLGFNYPEYQALCQYKNSSSLYRTKLHGAVQNYINYGQCDTFQLREKAGLSQTTVNSFCRVQNNASLRTMMVIMWINGITFR